MWWTCPATTPRAFSNGEKKKDAALGARRPPMRQAATRWSRMAKAWQGTLTFPTRVSRFDWMPTPFTYHRRHQFLDAG